MGQRLRVRITKAGPRFAVAEPVTNTQQSTTKPEEPRPPGKTPEIAQSKPRNHIYVGQKPVMSYAMSAMMQLAYSNEIILKARGMAISRAVDAAEILTKRLGGSFSKVKDI